MSKQPGSTRRARLSLAVGAVGVLAGLLFATNASLFAADSQRRPLDLADLVRVEQARLAETDARVQELRSDVEMLVASDSHAAHEGEASPELLLAAGHSAVSGPGVTVSLDDSPLIHNIPEGFRADDLLVHQQDLEGVINALWAGGAEAMTVQGHRVGPTSDVRCVGNVLLVDGSTYSPPYVVSAIGNAEQLRNGLAQSAAVQAYQRYVEAVRLGYSVVDEKALEMPRLQGGLSMQHARIPGDEPITWNPEVSEGDSA